MIDRPRVMIIIIFSIICSCNNKDKMNIHQKDSNIIEKWTEKEVVLPKSLKKLNPLKTTDLIEKNKFTIVVYYDGNCGQCFLQLKKWIDKINYFKTRDVNLKIVLSGNSMAIIKANLIDIQFPLDDIYYDEYEELPIKYNFLLDYSYQNSAMLLDNYNKILLIGNPTISENIFNEYAKLLEK